MPRHADASGGTGAMTGSALWAMWRIRSHASVAALQLVWFIALRPPSILPDNLSVRLFFHIKNYSGTL